MSREIIEAVQTIEREKGIDEGTLVGALEDALLAAYKKTPVAGHAVESTRRRVPRLFSIDIPKELEERLLDEAREHAIEISSTRGGDGERQHTLVNDDDLDLDWSQVPEELIHREDVTPDDFGRIAAQTAKQVILQRIREAERQMMYEEHRPRR